MLIGYSKIRLDSKNPNKLDIYFFQIVKITFYLLAA